MLRRIVWPVALIVVLVSSDAMAGIDPATCVRQYPGEGRQVVLSAASDANGNIAIAGWLEGIVNFGGERLIQHGERDMFVAVFDSRCAPLWSKRFGDVGADAIFVDVRFDPSGNVVLAGEAMGMWIEGANRPTPATLNFGGADLVTAGQYDIFVVKLAADGSHIWSKRFGGDGRQIVDRMALDRDGNIILAGEFDGTLDFGPGALDGAMFVAKLDPSGRTLYGRSFERSSGGDGYPTLTDLAVDDGGNIAVSVTFDGTLTFGSKTFPGAHYNWRALVAEFAADGSERWVHLYSPPTIKIAFGPDGDLYLVASIWTTPVAFGDFVLTGPGSVMTRVAPDGSHRWARVSKGDISSASGSPTLQIGDSEISWLAHVWTNFDFGGGVADGAFTGLVLARFDTYGRFLGYSAYRDNQVQVLGSMAIDRFGAALIAGSFSGTLAIGGTTLLDSDGGSFKREGNPTPEDIFVARLLTDAPASTTRTTLTSTLNPSRAGQTTTFTATIKASKGPAIPTGSVDFYDNGRKLATVSLDIAGVAKFSTALVPGRHSIEVGYNANAPFASSFDEVSQTVTGTSRRRAADH